MVPQKSGSMTTIPLVLAVLVWYNKFLRAACSAPPSVLRYPHAPSLRHPHALPQTANGRRQ